MTPIALALAEEIARKFEGCKLVAYQDPNGIWTLGYGHTRAVTRGMHCTQSQADNWLKDDLAEAAHGVDVWVNVPLTDHQAAALYDFIFNVGLGNFDASTLLKLLNAGQYRTVPVQLRRWVHDARGDTLPGLVARRQAEIECWNCPD